MRKGKLKKALALALTGAVIIGAFAGCGAKKDSSSDTKKEETKKIVIGASPSPHADILKVAKKELKKEGYELEIKEYSDYVQPNTALESGDLDTTNEARALLLLQDQGLIKLKDGAGLTATKKDIVENKKDLAIKEIEAAQIPRSLKDVDIAVVNGNYALQAGLKVNKDALATEDADSVGAKTYGNIVAVKKGNEKLAATKALIKALKSDTVKKYINDKYDGAVVPLF